MPSANVTRAARKRVAAASAAAIELHTPVSKKRVVLGELSNLSNSSIFPPVVLNEAQKPLNPRAKGEVKKGAKKAPVRSKLEPAQPKKKEDEGPGIDVRAEEDDPQMCRDDAADIYEYLHKMEVIVTFNYASWIHAF